MFDLSGKKPKISYPCFWSYKLILEADKDVKSLVSDALAGQESKISFSHFSKDKKYASYDVQVQVFGDSQRIENFEKLKKIAKFVL